MDLVPGSPGGREPRLPAFAQAPFGPGGHQGTGDPGIDPATGEPLGRSVQAQARRGDTCHLDVVDRWGNMVAATPSGGWLQSSPVIGSLGFPLGTRAQMFTLEPGLPATIAPRKRPRTTLSPSMALRDGEPYLAFGTPGGDQQDQWTLAFFLRHVHYGMNLQEAIDFPAFHSAHMPSSFYPRGSHPGRLDAESRIAPEVLDDLRRRGHDVAVHPPWSLGRVSAVARGASGLLYAAANPRGMQGYATGR
jgi:gamma-glutamyltranspeptidase/glutathione hydrolase